MKNIVIKLFLVLVGLLILNPITNANAEICECNSCNDCTLKLNDTFCTEVKLIKDIEIYQPEDIIEDPLEEKMSCINIRDTKNKIFDCQGNKIKAHKELKWDTNLIYIIGSKNITIKNCVISGFSEGWGFYGINLGLTNNSNLINNTISSVQIGIEISSFAYNTTIHNNTIFSNDIGIYMFQSSYNNISKNTIFSNGRSITGLGISIEYNSNFNEISNNKIYNNTGPGIFITGIYRTRYTLEHKKMYGNKIINNEIIENTYGIVSEQSDEVIAYSNIVCGNKKSDFYSSNWTGSKGDYNTCNNSDGWNDKEKNGCTYKCNEQQNKPTKPDYNLILSIAIIGIAIFLSAFVIWYKKFKKP